MYRLFQVISLIFISFLGYSQNEKAQISFLDSSERKIESNESYLVFSTNNKPDSIKLENIYSLSSSYEFQYYPSEDSPKYNVRCQKEEFIIVDSIDINHDGFKELFIFSKWDCNVIPPILRPYGVGTHQQNFSQYEVWDVQAKKNLFEIKNVLNGSVAVSTNVVRFYGYRYKVEIDEKGSFVLSDLSGVGNKHEMGTYVYDEELGEYSKE